MAWAWPALTWSLHCQLDDVSSIIANLQAGFYLQSLPYFTY
jgi:hypothetical protein